MPRGVRRSELEVVELEIKKLEERVDKAQSSLKKDKAALTKLRAKRESLLAHELLQHARKKSLSMDDVKALMENAGDKAAAATRSAIQKAEGVLEAAESKLPEAPAPAKKAPAKRAAAKKAAAKPGKAADK